MHYYQVRSYYGELRDRQFSSMNFPNHERALDYAEKQRKAMPRWYRRIQIVRIEETTTNDWFYTPNFSPSL